MMLLSFVFIPEKAPRARLTPRLQTRICCPSLRHQMKASRECFYTQEKASVFSPFFFSLNPDTIFKLGVISGFGSGEP